MLRLSAKHLTRHSHSVLEGKKLIAVKLSISRALKRTLGYLSILLVTQGYSRVLKGTDGYLRELNGTLGYSRVLMGT